VVVPDLPATLLLDLDDTILDDTGARDRCWTVACEEAAERHRHIDAVALRAEIESVREWFWADADRHTEWRQKMRQAWHRIASDSLARLGIDDETIGVEIGDRHYELRDSFRVPLPGATEALDRLRKKGVILGLLTNGNGPGQRAKIERFDLAVHFAYIGSKEVDHAAAPSPTRLHFAPRQRTDDDMDGGRQPPADVEAPAAGIRESGLTEQGTAPADPPCARSRFAQSRIYSTEQRISGDPPLAPVRNDA
jgi:putative hydrolase of the HAD superfamily